MLASVIAVLPIVNMFEGSIERLPQVPELSLPSDLYSLGWFGALLCAKGAMELFIGLGFCIKLFHCEQWVLFWCTAVTFVSTVTTSYYLGFFAVLRSIIRESADARQYAIENQALVAAALLISGARIQSLSILRLRICNRNVTQMPMPKKYFHFVKNAGMYHHIIGDIPHLVVSIVLLYVERCGESTASHWLPFSATTWAILRILFSASSLIWGIINKAVQLMTMHTMASSVNRRSLRQSLLSRLSRSVSGRAFDAAVGPPRAEEEFEMLPTSDDQHGRRNVLVSRATT
jgi:hypothetical protein